MQNQHTEQGRDDRLQGIKHAAAAGHSSHLRSMDQNAFSFSTQSAEEISGSSSKPQTTSRPS
ncbi:MAG: hypothetical protein ACI4PV_02460, partial [Butyricicoccus sp.]